MRTRTRQLANGKWVGEVKRNFLTPWSAVDSVNPNFFWSPGDDYYHDCQVETESLAAKAVTECLSHRYGI